MRGYSTIQGDTWDVISQKVYGHSLSMHHLIHANLDHIGVGVFSAGIKIRVPEDETVRITVNKPPWFD